MGQIVSKSQFKPKVLHYFRQVQEKGIELIITDHGKPVIRIIPYNTQNHTDILNGLRNTVIKYDDPTEPVGLEEWEVLS